MPTFSSACRRAVAACCLAVLAAGCGEPAADAIRFGLADAPVTLDPRFATDATSSRIIRLLYERLVDFDDALRPLPALASWQQLSPTLYRFVLHSPRRRFSDGSPLTAADVQATYQSVLEPERGSPHRGALAGIEAVVAVDENTVDFHLTAPDLLFPGKAVLGILPADAIRRGHPFASEPLGSGGFEMVAWPRENRLLLRRHRDGQMVELLRIPDPTTRVLKLLRGEVDMLQGDLSPEIVRWLDGRGRLRVTRARGNRFTYLGFNLADPVVGELRMRQAIAHAIDRASIIRYVLGDAARPASAILLPSHWAGDGTLAAIPHDLARAKALLRELGYGPGRPVRVVYKTSADPFRVRLATIIQSQLARAGVEVAVESHDWGTFYGDIKAGRFQMYSLSWVGIKTPDIFRYVFHSRAVPPQGANRGRFASAVADALIERAEAGATLAAQAESYRALQRHVLEMLPYVPLWFEDNVHVARRDIEGYWLDADGNYDGLDRVHRSVSSALEKLPEN